MFKVGPTMLVGVGGTGCQIVDRVHDTARKDGLIDDSKIVVIGLDTDDNDMRRLSSIESRYRLRFSTADTIYAIVNRYRDRIAHWFAPDEQLPERTKSMTLLKGAAQIRMLTHLGLYTSLLSEELPGRFGDAFAELGRHDNRDSYAGHVNVMLVGSLAGATGSGSFIQTALLIAEVARQREVNCDVRGLFLLPDVYVRGGNLPVDQVPNVLANGYAALKELNAVNAICEGREDARDFAYEHRPGGRVELGQHPFVSVTLIDYESSVGGVLGKGLELYKGVAQRAVFQQIFSPIGGRVDSVEANDARAKLRAAAAGTDNIYAGVGVGAVIYPVEDLRRFLTLSLAREHLSGDWLRLERLYDDRVSRFREQRDAGNFSVEEPDRGECFLEDLEQLGTREQNAFFREIYEALNPERTDTSGVTERRPEHAAYLTALVEEMVSAFWSGGELSEIRQRPQLDETALSNAPDLSAAVRERERMLDADLRKLDGALRDRPTDMFLNLLASAVDLPANAWRAHHLQNYIVKDGPHLVQVRAFLFGLQAEMARRRSAIEPTELRKRLFKLASRYDDDRGREPSERGTPQVLAKAAEAARGFSILGRRKREFIADYVTFFNQSARLMRQFADATVEDKLLTALDAEVAQLQRVIGGFFTEVGAVVERLDVDVEEERRRHDAQGAGLNTYWIDADAPAKDALWDAVRAQAGGREHEKRANAAISSALYQLYWERRRQRDGADYSEIRALFEQAIMEDFAAATINEEASELLEVSLLAALRRQCGRNAADWKARLRDIVQIVGRQSEPLLSTTDPINDGQRIVYWAVNPAIEKEFGDAALFNEVFTLNRGESPLVMPEFDRAELICFNTRVNLGLRQMAKLHPGDGAAHANAARPGNYFAAYQALAQELVDAQRERRRPLAITAHIHRDWHRPGAMPEIFSALASAYFERAYFAFVVSSAAGIIVSRQPYDAVITEYNSMPHLKTGGVRDELTAGADALATVVAFEARPDLVAATDEYWTEVRDKAVDARGAPTAAFDQINLVARAADPDFLLRLLEIGMVRREQHLREPRTRELVAAWAALLDEMVERHQSGLALDGRIAMRDALIADVRGAAFERLRQAGAAREDTVYELEQTYEAGMALFHQRRGA